MADIRMPLSGDVSQTINPWTWWIRAWGQFGFININETNTGDAELEQRIVREVASYGRQLGWTSEVLSIVLRHARYGDLTPAERDSIAQFDRVQTHVEAIKQGKRRDAARNELDRLVRTVADLKHTDRGLFDAVAARLRPIVAEDPAPPAPVARPALPAPSKPVAPRPTRRRPRR